jgi:hypothetical protein
VAATDDEITAALQRKIGSGVDRRRAVAETAADLRVPKRRVYAIGLALRNGS